MKSVSQHNFQNDSTKEKGLVIANFDLRQPMEINFINKQGIKITGHDHESAIGLKVNALMP